LKVGNPGDVGAVEISDIVITTQGGSAGAIGMYLFLHWTQAFADLTVLFPEGIEWNIKESSQGSAGMWDVHVRLGGTKVLSVALPKLTTSRLTTF
jgi:hypothetical protein